jgi:hypothetical protein
MILEEKYSVRPPYRRYTEEPVDTDVYTVDKKEVDKLNKELHERHRRQGEVIDLWKDIT